MSLLVPQTFWDRLSLLHDSLATGECWNDVDSIAVPIDPPSEDAAFTKSSAFFIHLFGLELHDSLAILCKGALHVLATDEKCAMLKALQEEGQSAGLKFQLHRFDLPHYSQLLGKFGPRVCKDNHESTHAILAKLVKSQAGRKIGWLEKIQFQSTLALALNKAIQSARACIDNRNLECLQADTNRMKIGWRRMYRCDFCTWYGTKCQRWSRTGHFSEGSSSNT